MAFKHIVILAIVSCCCSAESLRKCCPKDQGIMYMHRSGFKEYECTEALLNENTAIINKTMHPLLSGHNNVEFSYGFPSKCTFQEIPYSEYLTVPSDNCVDKVFAIKLENGTSVIGEGNVIYLACDASVVPRHEMITLSKCCLKNMVYNTENHLCMNRSPLNIDDVKRNDSKLGMFEQFIENESTLLNVNYGSPYCPNSKAIYNYLDTSFEFDLNGSKILIYRKNSTENFELEPGTFCIDENHNESLLVRGCRDIYETAARVVKCCPEGHIYEFRQPGCKNGTRCVPNSDWGLPIEFYKSVNDFDNNKTASQPDVLGITYEISCKKTYKIDDDDPLERGYLDAKTGDLVTPKFHEMYPVYCKEMFKPNCGKQKPMMITLSCFPDNTNIDKIRKKLAVYSVGLVISSIFLAITLLVYIVLPPLRNLHGKTIMCHVAVMLVAFSCLARVQWSKVKTEYCRILGYTIYFSFVAAFSWLNVMCFDIWWTFVNVNRMQSIRRDKDLMRFIRYSLYAWGVPTVLTITTLLLDVYDVQWLDPNIGEPQCWINSSRYKLPLLIVFILPVGIQITANLVFFILTAIYCNKVKSEIHRMQAGSMGDRCKRRFTADKAKLAMNLKLFIVMGVSWVLEILSSLITDPIELWYVADAINVLQGIPIFCILVLKRKIFFLIKKRLGSKKTRKPPSFEDPKLLSCLERVIRPRSDITMTTGLSSSGSEGRKSLQSRKSEIGMNGLLLSKSTENGKSP